MIHFELNFVYNDDVRYKPVSFILHMDIQLFKHHLLKRLSVLSSFCHFVKNKLSVMCGFISDLSILFHLTICLDLHHPALIIVALQVLNWVT